ncbi:MAG: GH25 family lysozyme [Clostridia bacterium]|nr:GH25 family lysozyme [Clostridia bacterium]
MKKFFAIALLLTLAICPLAAAQDEFEPSSRPLFRGIDISQYNDVVNFDQVRDSGIDMVYIRSSLGFSYVDSRFERNADGCQEAGLEFGFYHFCTASTAEQAERQAEFFHEVTRNYSPRLRHVLEFSPSDRLDRETFNEVALAFLERIEELTGSTPGIYSDASSARDRYDSRAGVYPLWVADWGADRPEPVDNWRAWAGWQYGGSDHISGIDSRVDLDYFTKEMRVSQSPTPTPAPTPVPTPTPAPGGCGLYVVQNGDTLTAIARRFDTTVQALMDDNALSGSTIYPGQILRYARSDAE